MTQAELGCCIVRSFRSRAFLLAIALAGAASLNDGVRAQAPHGGANVAPQPGANVNAAGGIVLDPFDPAAIVKTDILQQRQNETVLAPSFRNADALMAAWNDYRFVDFPHDEFFGEQSFIAKVLSKPISVLARALGLRGDPAGEEAERRGGGFGRRAPRGAVATFGAWTGVGRSCDRGQTWIGAALPGGPADNSPASLGSPLKELSNLGEAQGGHAETTDPVLLSGPNGRMHLFVLGFIRFPNGNVGESRMYYSSYFHANDHEGGGCFTFNFTTEVDRASTYGPTAFIDKGSGAVDKDGTLYYAYTAFTDSVHSKIVIARSTDGGLTWARTSPLLNLGFLQNHGSSIAVDSNGFVHVAWRTFYQNWPLMLISHSYDRGKIFTPGTPISHFWPTKSLNEILAQLKAAKLQPYDQRTSPRGAPAAMATARSLGLPSIAAGVVNGRPKLFAVWQERVDVDPTSPTFRWPLATGSPRVVMSMSDNGFFWTPRLAVDAGPRTIQSQVGEVVPRPSGPQVQPAVTISGRTNAQLLVSYYEARRELNVPFEFNFISGIDRQMDLRVARLNPVTGALLAPSVQVSQYLIKANTNPAAPPQVLDTAAPGVAQANYENFIMYDGGFGGFFGDYHSIVPSITLEYGSGVNWAADPSSSFVIWSDNRDVRIPRSAPGAPQDMTITPWPYTPVPVAKPGSPIPPLPPADCTNVGTRNANPYFAEIAGVIAGTPQSFKPLNIQRAFATYVANPGPLDRFYRLTIQDDEAAGVDGSFDQFDFTKDVVDLKIFGRSSHAQTIWVNPNLANPTASVRMTVEEIDAIGGAVKPNGYKTSLKLNPDPTNGALTNVPPTGPVPPGTDTSINVSELHGPKISTPQSSVYPISSPQSSMPQSSVPQSSVPQSSMPQSSVPQSSIPQSSMPQSSIPQSSIATPGDPPNGTELDYTVTNGGTTNTVYNASFNVPGVDAMIASGNYQFQMLITKTSLAPGALQTAAGCVASAEIKTQVVANIPITTMEAADGTIKTPQSSVPQSSVSGIATFALAPEGGAASAPGAFSIAAAPNDDAQSAVLPAEMNVILRAIRMRSVAEIVASGGQLFDSTRVTLRVDSTSTDVINTVVQPNGTQPGAVTRPDLTIVNYNPASPALTVAAGGQVTLSAWRHLNQGNAGANAADGIVRNGFYLSTDAVITSSDTRLDGNNNTNGVLPAGGFFDWGGPTLTIPVSTTPGSYYIGILVDDQNKVDESNEGNNYVSEPITVTAAQACLVPPANLVAWWPGDGNFRDIQGGNDGFDGSEDGVTFAAGKVGPAFTLNGNGAHVVIPDADSAALRPPQLTLDFWFKSNVPLNSDTREAPLVVKLNSNDDVLSNSKGYDFFYEGTAVRFGLRRSDGFRVIAQRPGAIAANEWHHVAGTFDGRYQRLYFDGALVDTVDWLVNEYGTPTYVAPASILIGMARNSAFTPGFPTEYFFGGQVDEVELFNRALTQSEIQDVYNTKGKCRPIVLSSDQQLGVFGAPLTLSALVIPAPTSEGAMVEFVDGQTVLGTGAVNAQGVATLTTSQLSFAPHVLTARSAGGGFLGNPSAPLTVHMVKRFNTRADFAAATAGVNVATETFETYAVGRSFKPPNDTLVPGVLTVGSSFNAYGPLEVFASGAGQVLFGYSNTAFNPRNWQFDGFGYYYLFFPFASNYNALGFDIAAQDPNSTPARVSVETINGSAVLPVSNTSGNELVNTFIGVITTSSISSVFIFEGCEFGFTRCVNEEIALDNFVVPTARVP